MCEVMYDEPGIGLAAPQVGEAIRLIVVDTEWSDEGHDRDALIVVNPELVQPEGSLTWNEGCLSVPDLTWEITRPKQIHLVGVDLDGNEVSIEADEIEARLFQHEIDHLDGILLVDHLDEDQAREARRALREMTMSRLASTSAGGQLAGGLRLR